MSSKTTVRIPFDAAKVKFMADARLCAVCSTEYDSAYDRCPKCVDRNRKRRRIVVIVGLLLSALAICAVAVITLKPMLISTLVPEHRIVGLWEASDGTRIAFSRSDPGQGSLDTYAANGDYFKAGYYKWEDEGLLSLREITLHDDFVSEGQSGLATIRFLPNGNLVFGASGIFQEKEYRRIEK